MKEITGGVTAAKGFQAASTAAGIKYKDRKDMAMIYSEVPCKAAGTFTTNIVKAAPVKWDQEVVYHSESAQAVIINSGIANACTGAEGYGYCKETAEAAGISASYLSRLFKKETGMLFVDYIQKERIEAACNMLTYSDYTAAQISEYLCFSTQSYFIKIFRKYTGTTPAKYKKYKVQDWK